MIAGARETVDGANDAAAKLAAASPEMRARDGVVAL